MCRPVIQRLIAIKKCTVHLSIHSKVNVPLSGIKLSAYRTAYAIAGSKRCTGWAFEETLKTIHWSVTTVTTNDHHTVPIIRSNSYGRVIERRVVVFRHGL